MADLVITAANVVTGTNSSTQYKIAGATLTAGQVVYIKVADGKAYPAQSNGPAPSTNLANAAAFGIALNAASAGQPVAIEVSGQITIGATVAIGTIYVVSAAVAGNICPWADLGTNNWLTILGYADTATTLQLVINATGIGHA